MRADLLAEPIAGLDEALMAADTFDRTLVGGLLRPQPTQAAGLAELACAVAGTPLASPVAKAAEKAAAGAASEDHLVVLATARTALLGSVHDALMARIDEATGRIAGVTADGRAYRARLVVAADGNSSRLSLAMGLRKRDDRPLGVAIRTYYTSPRHDDDYLETWLDLWDGSALLPGYGWVFGVGDGTSNVGLGLLNTSASFGHVDYRAMLRRWLASMPATMSVSAMLTS